ncbi:T9SS type A sorting domain-containing protein [Bacteroidota bacterium]
MIFRVFLPTLYSLILITNGFALAYSQIINVPTDKASIQTAIDASSDGDTILVAPGIYYENIEVLKKNDLTILGSGSDITIINGSGNGHAVVFNVASGKISKFTITNSGNDYGHYAGIFTSQASVFIEENIINSNNNGISISSNSDVIINRNQICNNSGRKSIGFSSSNGNVSNNLIINNSSHGIYAFNSSLKIHNNTIIGNGDHFAITLNPIDTQIVVNNIITNYKYGIMVLGDSVSLSGLVKISYNNLWKNSEANYWEEYGVYYILDEWSSVQNSYSGIFSPQPGNGEIQRDPIYVNPEIGDIRLSAISPCINAGNPDITDIDLMLIDMAGNPRIFGDTIDIGSLEYQGYLLPTASVSGKAIICEGETTDIAIELTGTPPWEVTFTDGTANTNITTSENPYIFEVSAAGTYKVIALSDAYYIGEDFGNNLDVNIIPLPIASYNYELEGLSVTFTNLSDHASSYFWDFGDGNTETIENPTHTYASSGDYQVVLTSYSEYCGESTNKQSVNVISGINSIAFSDLAKVFPNPSRGIFNFEVNTLINNDLIVKIFDVNGQVIHAKNKITKTIEEIDLSNYAQGIYFIQVRSDKYFKTEKLIIE